MNHQLNKPCGHRIKPLFCFTLPGLLSACGSARCYHSGITGMATISQTVTISIPPLVSIVSVNDAKANAAVVGDVLSGNYHYVDVGTII